MSLLLVIASSRLLAPLAALALACGPSQVAPRPEPAHVVPDLSELGPSVVLNGGGGVWDDIERPVATPERPWVYTTEQLRAGDILHVLHGSGPMWTPSEHDAYRESFADVAPYIVRFGLNIAPSPRFGVNEVVRGVRTTLRTYTQQIPLLTVKFDKHDNRTGLGQGMSRQVLDGEMDVALEMLAGVLAADSRPFFVRIGPECNGHWNGYDPELFPRAFRYIADKLRAGGAEIITLWNVKLVQEMPLHELEWYPGDDAVDWWSIDLFTDDFRQPKTRQRVQDFLDEARRRGKPVAIPESCPNGLELDDTRTWGRWFGPYFDLIESDENIKMFCYSNRDFARNDVRLKDWGDMRVDQSRLAGRYRQRLQNPLYLHQDGEVERRGSDPRDPRRGGRSQGRGSEDPGSR